MLQMIRKEDDLVRRMKLMKKTYKIQKKSKLKAAALVAVMIVASTCSVSAATVAVGDAYVEAYNATVVDVKEMNIADLEDFYGTFEEYEETGDFPEGVTVTIGEVNTNTRSGDPTFGWTINASAATKTDNFSATSGQTIVVMVAATSKSATFRAGIIEPDGTRRYVESINGMTAYTFELDQTGKYSVYVQNMGSSKITVNGSYTVQD
jgi:hypothetical protein